MNNYTTIRGSKGKYPYHEGKHLIVEIELHTFADESGMHGNPEYCLVLGFIGSPRQWKLFDKEWRGILQDYDAPEFHARDFFGRNPKGTKGIYDSWAPSKANSFLKDLLSVAGRYPLHPVGGGVYVPDFNSFTLDERRFITGGFILKSGKWTTSGAPSKPYYFAMNLLVVEALKQAHGAMVHFHFDELNSLEMRAIQTLRETATVGLLSDGQNTRQMGQYIFSNSVDSPGIQLADMYCYAWNRYLIKKESTQDSILQILEILTPKRRVKNVPGIGIWFRPEFEHLLNKLPNDISNRLSGDSL